MSPYKQQRLKQMDSLLARIEQNPGLDAGGLPKGEASWLPRLEKQGHIRYGTKKGKTGWYLSDHLPNVGISMQVCLCGCIDAVHEGGTGRCNDQGCKCPAFTSGPEEGSKDELPAKAPLVEPLPRDDSRIHAEVVLGGLDMVEYSLSDLNGYNGAQQACIILAETKLREAKQALEEFIRLRLRMC